MNLTTISKDDLLIKLKALQAQNTLLRNQITECGKDKAYINELEQKLSKDRQIMKEQRVRIAQLCKERKGLKKEIHILKYL